MVGIGRVTLTFLSVNVFQGEGGCEVINELFHCFYWLRKVHGGWVWWVLGG